MLQFGTYDLAARTPAGRLISDEYFLAAYAGTAPDRANPDISPLFAELAGLPPILIVIGSDDILLEDNLAMAARLSAAGVSVELRIYPAAPHGFTGHPTPLALRPSTTSTHGSEPDSTPAPSVWLVKNAVVVDESVVPRPPLR